MQLKRDMEHALRVLCYIGAHQSGDEYIRRKDLAVAAKCSFDTQQRVCRKLVEGGYLERIPMDGSAAYRLLVPLEKITLEELALLIEDSIQLDRAFSYIDGDPSYKQRQWAVVQKKIEKVFSGVTAADFCQRKATGPDRPASIV